MITITKNDVTHEVTVTCISSILSCFDRINKIGYNNELLVRNKADLQHFKETTVGRFVVMGRNTFDSLEGKILSDRVNFVLTRDYGRQDIIENLFIDINSSSGVTKVIPGNQILLYQYLWENQIPNIYVIGGEQIFNEFFPCTDVSIISFFETKDIDIKANRFFPQIGPEWIEKKTTLVYGEPFRISYLYNTKKPNRLVIL